MNKQLNDAVEIRAFQFVTCEVQLRSGEKNKQIVEQVPKNINKNSNHLLLLAL